MSESVEEHLTAENAEKRINHQGTQKHKEMRDG